jgi:YidC/Oxa1 family membrane protein insertase
MDKKTLLAMVLIAVVLLTMPMYQEYVLGVKPGEEQIEKTESQKIEEVPVEEEKIETAPVQEEFIEEIEAEEKVAEKNAIGDSVVKNITIETDNYLLELSSQGGGSLKKFILKNYIKYDSSYVNMISEKINNDITLTFQETSGNYVDTRDFIYSSNISDDYRYLKSPDDFIVKYTLDYKGTLITKEFIFNKDVYHIDLKVGFSNQKNLLNNNYQINWVNGLPPTESYIEDDSQYIHSFVYMAEELERFDIEDPGISEMTTFSGQADWVAVRTKYFLASISVLDADVSEGVYFQGEGIQHEDYMEKRFNTGFFAKKELNKDDIYRIYIGPLDYKELEKYDNNLDELVMNNSGYEKFFRPFSRYIILPLLEFFHSFIPNWGIVIIVFSIFIKVILYPLTKNSLKATKKMQTMQPKMAEIREKYKNDQQRLNKEMMALYKEHGNPLSGCLPQLLQMPLLFALFIVFRSTIQLRGATFIPGWINDLSQTDTIFTLPFSIPMYGNQFNVLPIIMAITMFLMQKMTIKDPKQKAMVYIMPVFMLVIFNRFPAGLNLYYSLINGLQIIQQKFVHADDKEDDQKKIAPHKRNKKKR